MNDTECLLMGCSEVSPVFLICLSPSPLGAAEYIPREEEISPQTALVTIRRLSHFHTFPSKKKTKMFFCLQKMHVRPSDFSLYINAVCGYMMLTKG